MRRLVFLNACLSLGLVVGLTIRAIQGRGDWWLLAGILCGMATVLISYDTLRRKAKP